MVLSIKRRISWLFILSLIPLWTHAQHYHDYEFRNFSFTVNSGASLGDANTNEYFLSSNFSTNTKDTPTFGAGLQYALTPAWSLELGYQRTQIRGLDKPFETQVNMISFKNIINLNQLLLINIITERVNPFLTAGIGYDMYRYKSPTDNIYNHNSSYNVGAGIAYKLSNTIDLFTHYDFHIGSNEMDNETEGWGADLINALTGGIRINLGKRNAIHPSWKPYPMDLSRSDYDLLISQVKRLDRISEQVDTLDKRNQETHHRLGTLISNNQAEIDSLKIRMDRLEERMDDLEQTLTTTQGEINPITVDQQSGVAELLPAGHYVQIFATYHMPIAQRIRTHAIQSLGDALPNAEEKIFIIKRKQYYEVLIGVFTEYNDASNIQKIMIDFHEDAYVISFPRPVNLLTDFEGLKVVD